MAKNALSHCGRRHKIWATTVAVCAADAAFTDGCEEGREEAMPEFRLVLAVTVRAPIERVYAVLADVERYPQLFRYMHDLQVMERRDKSLLAEVTEDMFGKVFRVLTRFTFDPPRKVTMEQVRGPFDRAIGWFTLTPQPDGTTRLEHGVEIVASGVLGWLGKKVLESGLAKRRMTEEVRAVKMAAEK
jgi:ribosome-associated toxin RatA of RatAB toxin-antitoxin module